MKDLLDAELLIEIEALRKEIDKLNKENLTLKSVIADNGLESEISNIKIISPEEQICIDGIRKLAEVFKNGTFDKNDALNFDVLHKNLRLIRGQTVKEPSKKNEKKADIKELLKIVEGGDV